MKKFRSVVKKYIFGYTVVGVCTVFFLIATILGNQYISGKYKEAIAEMVAISQLETAVNDLNECVNASYLWFSADALSHYDENRADVERQLAETKRQVEDHFLHEVSDTNWTIESYLEKCDELVVQLDTYLDGKKPGSYDELESQYTEQQELYSYVITGFQGS